MPFRSFGHDLAGSVENCGRMRTEADPNVVDIESVTHTFSPTERLTDMAVPVMAHVGLTPRRVNRTGHVQQDHDPEAAEENGNPAREDETAGAFACAFEHIPDDLAAAITDDCSVPTIGIGAGRDCDGQVLVDTDAVGLGEGTPPSGTPARRCLTRCATPSRQSSPGSPPPRNVAGTPTNSTRYTDSRRGRFPPADQQARGVLGLQTAGIGPSPLPGGGGGGDVTKGGCVGVEQARPRGCPLSGRV